METRRRIARKNPIGIISRSSGQCHKVLGQIVRHVARRFPSLPARSPTCETLLSYGRVDLLNALARKYLNANREWRWQYVFLQEHRWWNRRTPTPRGHSPSRQRHGDTPPETRWGRDAMGTLPPEPSDPCQCVSPKDSHPMGFQARNKQFLGRKDFFGNC